MLLSVGSQFCIGVEKYYRADIFSFLFIVEKNGLVRDFMNVCRVFFVSCGSQVVS